MQNKTLVRSSLVKAIISTWGNFNNPTGLNFSGQITLEAWVKPGATQGDPARILSHGPPTVSDFLPAAPDNSVTTLSEVFLRIDGGGTTYVAGSSTFTNGIGTTTYSASFPVPAGDLGGTNWIHLVGTYDGANWKLYRNGVAVATNAAALGALTVTNGDWAIGSTGNGWANNYSESVDEVAIYNFALSPTRIAAHYSIGRLGTNPITITRSGGNVVITWSVGILQQASVVTGPYTDVAGAVSPYTPPAGSTQKFYRLRF